VTDTHDYKTKILRADELNSTHVLVGDSGGLSAIYDSELTHDGTQLRLETEHCSFYADMDEEFFVLDEKEGAV
jgi:hypothetical protein